MTQALQIDPRLLNDSLSFRNFLQSSVHIRDVSPAGVSRTLQWQWWPWHDAWCRDIAGNPRIIALKARQLGFSWGIAALHVWDAMFSRGYLGGMSSQGQSEASESLEKCKFIIDNLPYGDPPPLSTRNETQLTFDGGGTILAFPSTEKAARGFTFNRFTADEAAFHAFAEVNFSAYEAATEHGQIIIFSSAGDEGEEKRVRNDWFQRMYQAAEAGENGFLARFYPWNLRPGRDAAWYEERRKRLSSRPGAFQREYPSTVQEAFRSFITMRFDSDVVDAGIRDSRLPLPTNLPESLMGAPVQVWTRPRVGLPYVIYTDAAEAKGRDYTATLVLEARTLNHVATLREREMEPTEHGRYAVALARWYNEAFAGVERNRGEAILYAYGVEHYPRVYWHQDPFGPPGQQQRESNKRLGLPVTEQTRPGLIDDLAVAIQSGALQSRDLDFWRECSTFMLDAQGRAQALRTRHDDLVMAMAGALRLSRQPGAQTLRTTTQGSRPRSYGYSEPMRS